MCKTSLLPRGLCPTARRPAIFVQLVERVEAKIKCVHLSCSSNRSATFVTNYSLNQVGVHMYKDLGILISSDLSFSKHYGNITAKAYRALGLIRPTFAAATTTHGKKLLFILVWCGPNYYIIALFYGDLKEIKLLERVCTEKS